MNKNKNKNKNITSLLLISIFKNVLKDEIVSSFIKFLELLQNDVHVEEVLRSYSDFSYYLYNAQYNQNLYDYVKHLIYTDENILSNGCGNCIKENNQIIQTAAYELSLFDKLLDFDYNFVKKIFINKFPEYSDIASHLPAFYTTGKESFNIDNILKSYSKYGYGIFACYNAFKFDSNKVIMPVKYFNAMTFDELKNYSYQKEVIRQNTEAFLNGKEANNVLLYGDRGCGKSSTVKALINEFSDYNLKIIQVYKESFIYLQELYEKIRNLPLKFIIFADDISFEEDDKNFSSIKAVLEGSLTNRPENTVIYATTNRMHLVKESFSSREGNEIHYNDTIDEMVSLSDRFGIMLTFSSLTKNEYLDIVKQIAGDCCVQISDDLYKQAEEFSMLKGIRTPRIARQFITDYISKH